MIEAKHVRKLARGRFCGSFENIRTPWPTYSEAFSACCGTICRHRGTASAKVASRRVRLKNVGIFRISTAWPLSSRTPEPHLAPAPPRTAQRTKITSRNQHQAYLTWLCARRVVRSSARSPRLRSSDMLPVRSHPLTLLCLSPCDTARVYCLDCYACLRFNQCRGCSDAPSVLMAVAKGVTPQDSRGRSAVRLLVTVSSP